jgi:4-hydroxybenzoate polyprenyltransferase
MLLAWLLLGSIAMRGAGCVYNDIVDADLDVTSGAHRAASGGERPGQQARGVGWLLALCLVGLVVLLQLRWEAQLVALGSLALVAAYPFMKRFTKFPQAWLGLVFTWGAPVGWIALRGDRLDVMLACSMPGPVLWCVGYDTIYACQDREDDALVGIGSSALTLGGHVKAPEWRGSMRGDWRLWATAVWLLRPDWLALLALRPGGAPPRLASADPGADSDGDNALARFRSNRTAGPARWRRPAGWSAMPRGAGLMCNLYRMTKGTAEVARLFAVEADPGANFAQEVYPGYPGLVVAEGRARAMHWGFPLVLTGKQGQKLKPKPVTNAREDKLLTGFWRDSMVHRRCLDPRQPVGRGRGREGADDPDLVWPARR